MLNWGKKKLLRNVQPKFSDFHKTSENKHNYCRIIHFNDKEQPKIKSNCVVTAKYGVLSFLPLFCMEQLRYFPNQYYIFISILQQIPDASPLGRFTTILPLSIIFIISAIVSIIKDIIKHKTDHKVNYTYVEVLRNGVMVQERWSDIGVGDILKIKNNEIFPADLILLSSSELRGTCRVATTDLDSETNLKIRQCPQETSHYTRLHDFIDLNGTIECELPNKLLYTFLGRMTIMNKITIPLDGKQFIHRGSILRNTNWIYGVVIYTGQETKLMLNQTANILKESKMDKTLNFQMKMVFLLVITLSLVCAMCSIQWTKKHFKSHWYFETKGIDAYTFFLQLISFFIIFHNTIPISLQVYVKAVRLLQAWFINKDIDMYHEESNTPAMVRSPYLNFELAKVKYIFADKTGTLTKNVMELKYFSIAGELYLEEIQNKIINKLNDYSSRNYILEFFRTMLICQTVVAEKSTYTDEIIYNDSSPDEKELVMGSQKFGFKFHARCPKSLTITTTLNVEENYDILNIIEYTNSRKRMSVIVRTPDSKIKLYCKGADTVIFKLLSKSGERYKNKTIEHLNYFSRAGFRTLCFAYVDISEKFYEKWKEEYLKASTVLINRNTAKNKVAEKIERKLKLIGVTAIENKLQDNVPKTMQALMTAGIKIWLLTGDKQESAINIGFSSKLISQDSHIIIFDKSKLMDLKQATSKKIHDRLTSIQTDCTLVINGSMLKHVLLDDIKMNFLKLCINCKSVICCRITPTQKAEIVDFITKYTNEVTVAIGDESNDIPMLHKASIGIGVIGFEELQASNASDYSIAKFEYLTKLLFVHGTWNYERVSMMIYFCYYKSIYFFSLQLWFAIYSGWSGQILFDRWNFCTFNVLFTATPPLIIGLFLTTYSADTRLKSPQLYSQTKNLLNNKMFWIWSVIALFHSIFLFWTCKFIMKHEVLWMEGIVGDYSVLGNTVYTSSLIVVCLKAGLHTQSWSFIVHFSTWASILSWISFIIIYNKLKKILLIFSISIDLNEIMFTSPMFWIALIFTTSIVLLIDLAIITIKRTLCNNDALKNNTRNTTN